MTKYYRNGEVPGAHQSTPQPTVKTESVVAEQLPIAMNENQRLESFTAGYGRGLEKPAGYVQVHLNPGKLKSERNTRDICCARCGATEESINHVFFLMFSSTSGLDVLKDTIKSNYFSN